MKVAALLIIALLLALTLVACGGGNESPPWSMTIEAKCAAAACPTFPLWDGTPRPTAVTTPPPGVPTATAAPQEEPTP